MSPVSFKRSCRQARSALDGNTKSHTKYIIVRLGGKVVVREDCRSGRLMPLYTPIYCDDAGRSFRDFLRENGAPPGNYMNSSVESRLEYVLGMSDSWRDQPV